jgi:CDP-diacylglycerol--glycerol-3-phosphate 3-phosphatidyltransferase
MNAPNILTIIRIILAILMPFLLLSNNVILEIAAFFVFLIAAITDIIDGKLARKYNLITNFGKIADPIADKILVHGTLISFAAMGLFNYWILVPILFREIYVTIYRLVAMKKGIVIAADNSGKIKTTIQIVGICIIYVYFIMSKYFIDMFPRGVLSIFILMNFILLVALFQTVYSGTIFYMKNRNNEKISVSD